MTEFLMFAEPMIPRNSGGEDETVPFTPTEMVPESPFPYFVRPENEPEYLARVVSKTTQAPHLPSTHCP